MTDRPDAGVSAYAPAKVNLTLRVLGQRTDGYHLIESLMVPVSLYDRIDMTVRAGDGSIRCAVDGPEPAPADENNLAATAARAVLEEVGVRASVDIRLNKHIPPGSGLGGGSSDAGAVLRLLPVLLERPVRASRLADLATRIGADVPFFIGCRPAIASGIGEVLCAVPHFPDLHLVVVVPVATVSTAWAYRNALPTAIELTSGPSSSSRSLRLRLRREPISSLLFNDFERGVAAAYPDVDRLKSALQRLGAEGTVMSGSGSAVVGVFRSRRLAAEAAAAIPSPDRAFAVRVLRRRPAVTDG